MSKMRDRIAYVFCFFIPLVLFGYPALAVTAQWMGDRDAEISGLTGVTDTLRAQLTYAVAHSKADKERPQIALDLGDASTIDSDVADRVHAVFARHRVGWTSINPSTSPTTNAALTSTKSTHVGVQASAITIEALGDFKGLEGAVAELPRGPVLAEVTRFTVQRVDPNDASRDPALKASIDLTYYVITASPQSSAAPGGRATPAASATAAGYAVPNGSPTPPAVIRPTEAVRAH